MFIDVHDKQYRKIDSNLAFDYNIIKQRPAFSSYLFIWSNKSQKVS